MFPVIVCVARDEKLYIEEFVRYHIGIGFKHIIIYDNEDKPTYENQLRRYKDYIKVMHLPPTAYKELDKNIREIALEDFANRFFLKTNITHVAHIDIDEYIVLKKNANIIDFINKNIIDDCEGIAINRRFFGSARNIEHTNRPVTMRFTLCQTDCDKKNVKLLFRKDQFIKYNSPQDVSLKSGHIKTTKGAIFQDPSTTDPDYTSIQLNCYRAKTLPEYKMKHLKNDSKEEHERVETEFALYDTNDKKDIFAQTFYKTHCVEWDLAPILAIY